MAPSTTDRAANPRELAALLEAREHDPFRVLGAFTSERGALVRAYRPDADSVWLELEQGPAPMRRVGTAGIYEWRGAAIERPYRLRVERAGKVRVGYDAYAFPPQPPERDLYLFGEGTHFQAYRLLGARCEVRTGVAGACFRVWAPNAERVSVVGDFNGWDGRVHPMASLGASGVWELFMPGLAADALYKYEIRARGGAIVLKSDPYAFAFEHRPGTAALLAGPSRHEWRDAEWMRARAARDWLHAPMAIYELHAGSWVRHGDGRYYGYRELAARLIPYVRELGFTHIELMPLSEHPLDESWGYQTTGYFAATSRYGSGDDLRAFVDACHQAGIGVILDWVPGHFPEDAFALACFDGSALYEHEDPRLGRHPEWHTHVFNFGRNEVRSFLLSSAHCWFAEFHTDGLRVDAVASMLYLDYARKPGEWLPNRHGGRENLEAIDFLRALNVMLHREFPGALSFAEESTAWPMVSRPVHVGGLGFSMKWNMGWMNDTLRYFTKDPVHRRHHHDLLTFAQLYAYSENFVLPLSHDEVVHGKGALLAKMPGDEWQKFANLRLLLACQATTPGKKLLFMGGEFGQRREWDCGRELDWGLVREPAHRGVQRLVADLNRLYVATRALHERDFEAEGFAWIDCHDAEQSVLSFLRSAADGSFVVVAANFTPVPRSRYRIGVPRAGDYRETLNTDSEHYGGSNLGNGGRICASGQGCMGQPASLELTLPPLALVVMAPC
ncbi:MAG: 1,4-alpha-glucan branching protein GlgB [Burkholderiales bacterium]